MTTAVIFYAQYIASKVGKTGLADVTVDIESIAKADGTKAVVATAQAASEGVGGFYYYRYATADLATYVYFAVFKTADGTVDQQWMPALTDVGVQIDPWVASSRTLTQTAAQVAAAVTGSALTITRYVTFRATLTGLTLTGSPVYFAVKRAIGDSDNDSLILIKASVGLTRINGAAASTAANGSITVSGSDLIIYLDEAETAKLPLGSAVYSVKRISSGDALQVTTGAATIADEAIKAIT